MIKKGFLLEKEYVQVEADRDFVDTLYKKFDNGNVRIVQYFDDDNGNKNVQEVFLTKEQLIELKGVI